MEVVMTRSLGRVTRKVAVLVVVPSALATWRVPVVAPAGTVAVSWVGN